MRNVKQVTEAIGRTAHLDLAWAAFQSFAGLPMNFPIHRQIRKIPTAQGLIWSQMWTHDLAQAAPIVLLHDALGCVALWRDLPQQLLHATGRTVVAYDRVGFGQSSAAAGPLPLSFITDEPHQGLAAVLQAWELETFVALGHSVGGSMALCAAAAYPQQCKSLITLAAQTCVEARTTAGIRLAQQQFAQPGAMERLAKYHGNKADWVLNAWTQTWLSDAFADWNLNAILPQVTCPTLVIHGELDEYGSLQHPKTIARGVQAPATVEIIPNCGHMPHKEHASYCLEVMAAHLAE